jgi:hypothetical protein
MPGAGPHETVTKLTGNGCALTLFSLRVDLLTVGGAMMSGDPGSGHTAMCSVNAFALLIFECILNLHIAPLN